MTTTQEPRQEPAPAARFIPGRILADRYRVIERAGEGAMGEVYRAEDLKLGQPVALKFLSQDLGRDPARLEALYAEVRVARQVSHPSVCRVHDIEDMDGLHFLSMEFVDGEDLASLLRRIGRLPADKAIEIAHEICAGMAAIHDRGVVHRDLKPANVMIDGRGHARITDFGLAELQGARTDPEVIVGTPAYMAPETLSGEQAPNVGTDLYSLGLVLYELFTGKRAHESATTLPELIRLRCNTPPPSPSKLLPELDPRVERAIVRCLDRDPAHRPGSALAVAALLPGGDPLGAALAAGRTPSPEMVAASTSGEEGLRPALAWGCLGALLAGLLVVVAVSPSTRVVPALPLPEPPEAMAAHARELLRDRGFPSNTVDRAYGYEYDPAAIERIAAQDSSRSRWDDLAQAWPPVVTFWYRESPAELVPSPPAYRVTWTDPPALVPGMVGVKLDVFGKLVEVRTPSGVSSASSGDGARAPGDALMPVLAPAPPTGAAPPFAPAAPAHPRTVLTVVIGAVRPALFLAALFIGAWLARRNLRADRGDRKRALRVALVMMTLRVLAWLLGAHHTLGSITQQLMTTVAWGLYDLAYGWVFYMAIEPYVRRLWPRVLVSSTRLLDGRHQDARVGRDLLIGCLVGTGIALAVAAHQAAPVLLGSPPGRPDNVGYVEHQLASLLGLRYELAEMVSLFRSNIVLAMGFVVLLVMARVTLRRAWAALLATFLIFVPLALPKGEFLALDLAFAVFVSLALLLVMMRVGLLAAVVALLTHAALQCAPLGMELGSWPTSRTVLALAIVGGVGVYGFIRSLGGRPAIRDVLAES